MIIHLDMLGLFLLNNENEFLHQKMNLVKKKYNIKFKLNEQKIESIMFVVIVTMHDPSKYIIFLVIFLVM